MYKKIHTQQQVYFCNKNKVKQKQNLLDNNKMSINLYQLVQLVEQKLMTTEVQNFSCQPYQSHIKYLKQKVDNKFISIQLKQKIISSLILIKYGSINIRLINKAIAQQNQSHQVFFVEQNQLHQHIPLLINYQVQKQHQIVREVWVYLKRLFLRNVHFLATLMGDALDKYKGHKTQQQLQLMRQQYRKIYNRTLYFVKFYKINKDKTISKLISYLTGYLRNVSHSDSNKLTFKQLIYVIHIIRDPQNPFHTSIQNWLKSLSPQTNSPINIMSNELVLKRHQLYEINKILGVNGTKIKASQLICLWKDLIEYVVREGDQEIQIKLGQGRQDQVKVNNLYSAKPILHTNQDNHKITQQIIIYDQSQQESQNVQDDQSSIDFQQFKLEV